MLANRNTINCTSETLLRLLHNSQLEDLYLSHHLVLNNSFNAAGSDLDSDPTKVILSGPSPDSDLQFLNPMRSRHERQTFSDI